MLRYVTKGVDNVIRELDPNIFNVDWAARKILILHILQLYLIATSRIFRTPMLLVRSAFEVDC